MRNMAYPANAAVSDVAIPIQKLCSRCLHLLLYLACSPQRPQKSVLSSSLLGHSHTGHSSAEHKVVAAISKPSMLNMCQKQRPTRTFRSANRKYLS